MRGSVLKLIELYKQHETRFKSTTERKDKIWQDVAAEMVHYTAVQCENKWKYLKLKYMKKLDNMSDWATGSRPVVLKYFENMHNVLGKKHNAVPLAVAGSLEGDLQSKSS